MAGPEPPEYALLVELILAHGTLLARHRARLWMYYGVANNTVLHTLEHFIKVADPLLEGCGEADVIY